MDEHTLNDLLECSVCLERLDTSSKVLPCQHTFCRKCLEVIVSSRQELRCPECRVLVDVRIDELPPNVLLMRILEGMKNATRTQLGQQMEAPKIQFDNHNSQFSEQLQQHTQLKIKTLQQQQQQNQLLHYQQQQHRQQQQQNDTSQEKQHTLTAAATNNSVQTAATTKNHQMQLHTQPRCCVVPHAYALYDFDSGEASDLHFKKGDLIELKRKIDTNWYFGQLKGKEGTFPINYVQIIVPLPTPQCIALYDFKMGPNEEEGCLSFKKGTRINVLRRVDHNWAEGHIGTTIGIFPIAFAELNTLAKQLLDNYLLPPTSNSQPPQAQSQSSPLIAASQARNLPPIPLLDPTSNAHAANSSDGNSSSSANSSSSSAASSHTTSPNSTTTTISSVTHAPIPNCNCSSMPSSPLQSLPSTPQHVAISSVISPVSFRDDRKGKRHSLNALLARGGGSNTPTLSVLQTNRHSAEILSVPQELSDTVTTTAGNSLHMRPLSSGADAPFPPTAEKPTTTLLREQQQLSTASTAHARVNVLKTIGQQNVPPTLPWGYLALYPYKPRKSDELELKKGCVYIVTERCLDGWFKGKNWQDIAGVFPGNYVTPLRNRDQQQLMHQWKYVPLQTTTTISQTNAHTNQQHILPQQLPELPPRQLTSDDSTANASTPTSTYVSSVWTNPLGNTVEAFFNRHKTPTAPVATTAATTDTREQDGKHKESTTATASTFSSSSCSTSSAAVNLMKRLTHMKSYSKSPNSNAITQQQQHNSSLIYALENSTLEHGSGDVLNVQHGAAHLSTHVHAQMHPVHVRSGSCPSQLLQSLPIDLINNATTATTQLNENMLNQQHKQQISALSINYGSQRIKGHKERPQLSQNARHANSQQQVTTATPTTTTLLTKCAQQHQQTQQHNYNHTSGGNIHHRKSQSLDANTLICGSGPIFTAALVAPYNIAASTTAAAIVASATTKSTQNNARESRFRCVVPYPPNSDIELQLHVGDIIYVQRKQKNGWYKGTHARTHKTGLFPASFVEPDV